MPIIKNENQTIQVEFGEGDVVPITVGLPQPNGSVVPAIVILPMHEAMVLNDPEKSERQKFTDFDIRLIFTNTNQVEFMMGQLEEARRILSASESNDEDLEVVEDSIG